MTRGGKREGAGKKPIYEKPMKMLSIRVPDFLIDKLKSVENYNALIIKLLLKHFKLKEK